MKIRGSHLVALAIAAGLVGWMFTGKVIIGGQADPTQPTIVEREAGRSDKAFRVRTQRIEPTERQASLLVRGRTVADTKVAVRAETGGTVETRPVSEGDAVKAGDLLCTIDRGVREMSLTQAQAAVEQAQADYDANNELMQRGFTTRSRVRALKTALDTAKASLATAEQDISRTEVRASVAGVVQAPLSAPGDNLSPGGVCVTLMDIDPMLFTGQVSERDVNALTLGMTAQVNLVTGQNVEGSLTRIGVAADEKTRTFEVEMELPNTSGTLREGLTAEAAIALAPTSAYELAANWLTLADDGSVGVRAVDGDNKVTFHPIRILSQNEKTVWASGLTPGLSVIVLGQNFVAAGEVVEPVPADKASAQTSSVANGSATQ